MAKHRRPPSRSWKTFLRNHLSASASIDLFVVPTATFKLLYGMVILHHKRRSLVSFGVTSNPTAEWMARQIADAFPWEEAPRHLIRDRDRIYDQPSSDDFTPWAFETIRQHRDHVAKSICGTAHRFHPARMSRPYNRDRRGSSAQRPKIVRKLLQRGADAPIPGQRCTELSANPAVRPDRRHLRPRRLASSVLPDVVLSSDTSPNTWIGPMAQHFLLSARARTLSQGSCPWIRTDAMVSMPTVRSHGRTTSLLTTIGQHCSAPCRSAKLS